MRRIAPLAVLVLLAACGQRAVERPRSGATPSPTLAAPASPDAPTPSPAGSAIADPSPDAPVADPEDAARLTGEWNGRWTDERGLTGGITLRLEGTSGTLALSDNPCFGRGPVTVRLRGSTIAFEAEANGERVAFEGTALAGELSGTFRSTCGRPGTWATGKAGTRGGD